MLIGATPEGRKKLVGFTDGARESAQDWRDLLLDLSCLPACRQTASPRSSVR